MELGRKLLHDRFLKAAVSQVEIRAEDQQDLDHLAGTFVDPGVAVQLQNDNSQILYGRRGTGKTHLLKVIQAHLHELDHTGRVVVYIDMRKLGSSSTFEDTTRPISVRVAGLLRDVLDLIHGAVLAHLTDPDAPISVTSRALDDLDAFERAILGALSKEGPVADGPRDRRRSERPSSGLEIWTSPAPSAGAPPAAEGPDATATSAEPPRLLVFSKITQTVSDVLGSCGIEHLTVLFDEWNHIPIDLQPLLAEFLRKALICLPQIAVKIATLEYRTNFRETRDAQNNVIGFELGADIATALELDEYFVYYGVKSKAPGHFAELLFRHITREVDRQSATESYLERRHGISSHADLLDSLFVGRRTFLELVRAGEGVARDFINVFSKAFFAAVRDDDPGITASAIRVAAAEWYELDKALNIQEREEQALAIMCEQVIARQGTVNFLLSRRAERCALFRALVDLRLIHLLKRGYRPDPRNPAGRYNIYALDYGTYAHLLGGREAPQLVTIEHMRTHRTPLVLLDELVRSLDAAVGPLKTPGERHYTSVVATG